MTTTRHHPFTQADADAVAGQWIRMRYKTQGSWWTATAHVRCGFLMERTCPGLGYLGMDLVLHRPGLPPMPTHWGLGPGDSYTIIDGPPETGA